MKTFNRFAIGMMLAGCTAVMCTPSLLASDREAPHWSYEGETGPSHWGELSDEYRFCSEGANQSPIDLVADIDANLPKLEFEYYSSPIDEVNNGHSIQQNIPPGSFLKIPDRGLQFELKQFHFHSPSEHTVNGRSYAMEMHFVHADEKGALMVVGVFISEGNKNPVLDKLWAFMPENPGESSKQPVGIEETDLLPPTRDYFSYSGSLTTPPCSEGVRWVVLKTPIEASAEQIATFKRRVGDATNRPVQPHNARSILD